MNPESVELFSLPIPDPEDRPYHLEFSQSILAAHELFRQRKWGQSAEVGSGLNGT